MLNFVVKLSREQKRSILLVVDLLLVPIVIAATLSLQMDISEVAEHVSENWPLSLLMMLCTAAISMMLGVFRIRLKGFDGTAVAKIALYSALLSVAAYAVTHVGRLDAPVRFHITFAILFFLACTGSRFAMLKMLVSIYRSGHSIKRVVIYGAGKTGAQLASALKSHPEIIPVAFLDDNIALRSQIVHGIPVYHGAELAQALEQTDPHRIVIAMPSADRSSVARLERRLAETGVEVQVVPSFAQLIGAETYTSRLQHAAPGAFLGRDDIHKDIDIGCSQYHGRSVLVTGAGGSIGSELCRQIITCRPSKLVLFELSELALYNIEMELREFAKDYDLALVPVLGSVADQSYVARILHDHKVEVVLHAAAYKHVPLVENNAVKGLQNNVFGTFSVASAVREANVQRFVLISSDKAVRPANIMGASKRLAELVVQNFANSSNGTVYSTVRFGNVLGSSGSVIPLFQEQVTRGGPVTLTDNEVTRYFMTVQEAAQLVLTAGSLAKGGDVFVLDMGEPVPIRKLAEQVIESAGYTVRDKANPDGDIEIVTTGLRPGEKLHEELSISPGHMVTAHKKIFRVNEEGLSEIELARALKALRHAIETNDSTAAKRVIEEWVEGYAGLTAKAL